MSAQPATARRTRPAARRRAVPRARAAPAADAGRAAWRSSSSRCSSLVEPADHAVKEITLPLRHEDIIRQQAADKRRRRVADRRGHLHRVALPRPDLARRRQGPDADHAGDRRLHRAQVRRHALRARRPRHAADQHRLRHLVPALPADEVPRQHDPHPGRLQRGRGQGRRVAARGVARAASASRSPTTSRSRRRATTCTACCPRARTTARTYARELALELE